LGEILEVRRKEMKHIITGYPADTPYHDDMLGEGVFIIGLPFWDIFEDDSRSHHFFGDFRILNGTPLGAMDEALEKLAIALRAMQRAIILAKIDKEGWADMEWTEGTLRSTRRAKARHSGKRRGS